jgi:hypothetical protein
MTKHHLAHLLLGILLWLSPSAIHAQDDTFDPALFFPENVEIIDTEVIENTISPYVRWDDASREVTVFFNDRIAQYPYPEQVLSFYRVSRPIWQDRAVLTGYGEGGSEMSEWYVLNILTGDITLYEAQCGDNSPPFFSTDLDDDLWVLEATPAGYVLCASLTGEHTLPLALPDDFAPMEQVGSFSSLSPDFTRVLFLGDKGEVYLYTFANEQVTRLGTMLGDEWRVNYFGWADNKHFILSSRIGNLCSIYLIDVSRTDELKPGLETSPECAYPRRDTTMGRVIFNHLKAVGEDSPLLNFTQAIYDLTTGEWQHYDYGRLGFPDYGSMDGVGYYRAVSEDLTRADVVRFNPLTGERETIFEGGEIEWVRWASEDERYAVLVLDTSGRIDRIPGSYADSWYGFGEMSLALVELASGTIPYTIPVDWDDEVSRDILSDITLLREDLLLVEIRELVITPSLGDSYLVGSHHVQSQVVQLTNGDPILTEVGEVLAVMSDQTRLLIWTEGANVSTAVHVYHIATGDTAPVLKAVNRAQYRVNIYVGDTLDTAVVTVYPVVEGSADVRQGVRYTIRF